MLLGRRQISFRRSTARLAAGLGLVLAVDAAQAGRLIIGEDPPPAAPIQATLPLPAPADPGAVLRGFSAPLPLDIVVRQLVPSSLPVRFSPGVNSAQRAGWRGGRGWRLILADMLAPLSLGFEERAGTVWVVPRRPTAPAASQTGPIPLRAAAAPAPAPAPKLIGWQLRSAVPGRAWVVPPNAGSAAALTAIAEGQTIETLGRVEHIERRDGRWIVEAQNGWFEGDMP